MAPKIKIPVRRTGRALAHLHSKPSPHTRLVPHFAGTLRSPQIEMRSAHGWRQPELHFGEARTRFPASHEPPPAIRGNPARPRIENALRAWVEAASSLLLTKKTGHPNRMSCFTLERATRLELASRHPTNRLRRFAGTLPDLGLKTRFARGWRQRVRETGLHCKK